MYTKPKLFSLKYAKNAGRICSPYKFELRACLKIIFFFLFLNITTIRMWLEFYVKKKDVNGN